MIKSLQSVNQQTMYDLCLQAYGTLDLLVKFCNDNSITDINYVPPLPQTFYFDDSLITDQQTNTYVYTSQPTAIPATCALITGLTNTLITDNSLGFLWSDAGATLYQYAYNTTGDDPDSGDWIDTIATGVILTGLTDGTTYYFFIRVLCTNGVYSGNTLLSEDTTIAPPAPPVAGAILSLFSTAGVTTAGSNVTEWDDQSGNGNDVFPIVVGPQLTPSAFGTKPGIFFNASGGTKTMATGGDIFGLDGEVACTTYIVVKFPLPSGGQQLIYYSTAPGGILPGEFETYTDPALSGTISAHLRGNVGFCIGRILTTTDVSAVYTIRQDYSKIATLELEMLKNNSDTDFTLLTSNENTATFGSAPFGVGAGTQTIGCVLLYVGNHTPTEELATVNYLKSYFGIA